MSHEADENRANESKLAKQRASEDLHMIRRLVELDAFQEYYMRRFDEEIESQRNRVLTKEYDDPQELLTDQKIYRAMLKMRAMPQVDAASAMKELGMNEPEEWTPPDKTQKSTYSV